MGKKRIFLKAYQEEQMGHFNHPNVKIVFVKLFLKNIAYPLPWIFCILLFFYDKRLVAKKLRFVVFDFFYFLLPLAIIATQGVLLTFFA